LQLKLGQIERECQCPITKSLGQIMAASTAFLRSFCEANRPARERVTTAVGSELRGYKSADH
jgi:hypothetical protein